jgi:hypothetical protein
MHTILAAVLLSVTLSAPFDTAEARATDVGPEGLTIEVEVTVDQSALVVLARGIGPVDELPPVALSELSEGRWGGIIELPVVADIFVGFELIGPDGGSAVVSELHRLTDLGVDPAVFDAAPPPTTDQASGDTTTTEATAAATDGDERSTGLIWLGIATGAAALALLLIWWLPSKSDDDEPADEGEQRLHDGTVIS